MYKKRTKMTLNFVFNSGCHTRYNNYTLVYDEQQIANRLIKVEPNIEGCEGYDIKGGDGYIVTIFNSDGEHPIWKDNIQMTPKPMKIVSQTSEKVILRGFPVKALTPTGWIDFNGSDYGLSVFYKNGDVYKCVLHMHDRNIDIEYNIDNNNSMNEEHEIIPLARKAISQYIRDEITDAPSLLMQIYISVKENPSQLKNIEEFSIIGTAFLLMLQQELSEDIDVLQMMASVSYLFICKAIENNKENLNLYKDRLFVMKYAQEPFSYTVMSALNINSNPLDFFSSMATFTAKDEIYKMEIADLELHPRLYRQLMVFMERKIELDTNISNKHFSHNSIAEIIYEGLENHNKVFKYLENKILFEEDVDF